MDLRRVTGRTIWFSSSAGPGQNDPGYRRWYPPAATPETALCDALRVAGPGGASVADLIAATGMSRPSMQVAKALGGTICVDHPPNPQANWYNQKQMGGGGEPYY